MTARKRDGRLWARFTLDFADSPKIAALSDSAFRTLVEMILYSRRLLTDGRIREDVACKRWSSDSLGELLANDSRNPSLSLHDGFYVIHDFLEQQDSREEVESRKRRNQANGQRGGVAKSKRLASDSLSDSLSENVAETETETEIYTTPNGVVGNGEKSADGKSKPKSSKTLIPDGWEPNGHHRDLASQHGVDIGVEAQKFRAYAESNAKRYASWDRAFDNWILNADNFNRPKRGSYVNRAQLRYEQNMRRVAQAESKPAPQLTGGADNDFGF